MAALPSRSCAAVLGAIACFVTIRDARAQRSPLLFREPAVGATQICFGYGGDIWLVPRAGGTAHRLTSSQGTASGCHFSPDGQWIAFTAARDGNEDVYVVPTTGGASRRISYNPASDQVRGWTPDGKILFTSNRMGEFFGGALPPRLFVQAMDAVVATPIDLPTGWDGSLSADGRRLAYMPIIPANDIWKRYRGGRTTPIWIARLADATVETIPRDNSTDKAPMWVGDTVFFLSDRDGPTTLYAYDLAKKQVKRVVDNKGLDIKNASAGPGAIVYEQFGVVRLHDLHTGADAAVPIKLEGEITALLTRWVKVSDKLRSPAISPTGARAAFEARGEIITVPAKKGDARNVTRTVGAT